MKKLFSSHTFQMVAFSVLVAVAVMLGVIDPGAASVMGLVGAVVSVKSTVIANRDAVPTVISNRTLSGNKVMHARGVCAIANLDDIASKYYFCSVPSNAVIISLRASAPDIGTTTVGDFGLYKSTLDGGAVADVDYFKAAVSLKDGAISKSELLFGNAVTVAKSEQPIWQILGLTSDPRITYDIALTLTAAADGAGAVLVEVDYSV